MASQESEIEVRAPKLRKVALTMDKGHRMMSLTMFVLHVGKPENGRVDPLTAQAKWKKMWSCPSSVIDSLGELFNETDRVAVKIDDLVTIWDSQHQSKGYGMLGPQNKKATDEDISKADAMMVSGHQFGSGPSGSQDGMAMTDFINTIPFKALSRDRDHQTHSYKRQFLRAWHSLFHVMTSQSSSVYVILVDARCKNYAVKTPAANQTRPRP